MEFGKKIYITDEERLRLPKINESHPCKYLNGKGLCEVHPKRPIDCRLFPFDIIKKENKFYWIIWKFDCPIAKIANRRKLECYLREHEVNLLPMLNKQYLSEYANLPMTQWELDHGCRILRAVKI